MPSNPNIPDCPAPGKIGTWTCLALVVANMIGTGAFTSLGFQVGPIPSGFPILVLWSLGGGVALCGALCYAELALALPRSGGEYHFLSLIYHPALGVVAGITSALVGFAAPCALAAIALEKYADAAVPGLAPAPVAALSVPLLALVHSRSLKAGSAFQVTFTLLKVGLILAFLILGFLMPSAPDRVRFLPVPGDGGLMFGGAFAVSLMFVMYSYSGWNAVVYVLGEVRDVKRSVLPALVGGTLLVSGLYVGLQAVFLKAASIAALSGRVEAGAVAADHLLGPVGGKIFSGLVAFGLLSTLSALLWLGPRVLQAMGEDLRALRWFAVRSDAGIPLRALCFQTALALLLLLTATFERVLLFTQFTLTLCAFLTVTGVIVLRIRRPGLARPFRCPLHPLPALVFLAITGFSMAHLLRLHLVESLIGLVFMGLGLTFYTRSR